MKLLNLIILNHLFIIFCLNSSIEKNSNKVLLRSILINMDNDENITSEQYNKYYKSNNAIEGIKNIIKNNQFYINDFPIPGTENEFILNYPNGYLINQKTWLINKDGKYQVMLQMERIIQIE